MSNRWLSIGALAFAVHGAAQAEAADLSGKVGLVSDYRYRGLSLSDAKPALQGELDLAMGSGAYVGLWASTIRDNGSLQSELDLTAGDELELAPSISLDLSGTYYAYPGSPHDNYAEGTATASLEHGPLTGKLGLSFAPAQRALRDEGGRSHGNAYYFTSA